MLRDRPYETPAGGRAIFQLPGGALHGGATFGRAGRGQARRRASPRRMRRGAGVGVADAWRRGVPIATVTRATRRTGGREVGAGDLGLRGRLLNRGPLRGRVDSAPQLAT